MKIEDIDNIVNLHNTANMLLSHEQYVLRKFNWQETVTYSAYLSKETRNDKIEITFYKKDNTISIYILCKDYDYLQYMKKKNKKYEGRMTGIALAQFYFGNIDEFKNFMLDDFEAFINNYSIPIVDIF